MTEIFVKAKGPYNHTYWSKVDPERLTGRWKVDENGVIYIEYYYMRQVIDTEMQQYSSIFGIVRTREVRKYKWVTDEKPKWVPESDWRIDTIHTDAEGASDKVKRILTSK